MTSKPSPSAASMGGGPTQRRRRKKLAPSQKYEVFTAVLTSSATQRELSNGFATCDDPAGLQAICDRLGPAQIQGLFDRWMVVLPLPLSDHDRTAGYWWVRSMRQVEVSRTLVFDAPRHARAFFEALVADNLDIGRPDSVELVFTGPARVGRRPTLGCVPKTKVVTRGTEVTVNAFFKHSRVKQYLKDGRALRIETVVNSPYRLGLPPSAPPPAGVAVQGP